MLCEISYVRQVLREASIQDVLTMPAPDHQLSDLQRSDVRRWYIHSMDMMDIRKLSAYAAQILLEIPKERERYLERYPVLDEDYMTEESRITRLAHELAKLGSSFLHDMLVSKTPWPLVVQKHWSYFCSELRFLLTRGSMEQAINQLSLNKHTENFINDDRYLAYIASFLSKDELDLDWRPDVHLPEDDYAL